MGKNKQSGNNFLFSNKNHLAGFADRPTTHINMLTGESRRFIYACNNSNITLFPHSLQTQLNKTKELIFGQRIAKHKKRV